MNFCWRLFRDVDIVSASLYPKVFDEFEEFRSKYGPVDKLNTRIFLVGLENGQETEVRQETETCFVAGFSGK